MTAAALEFIQDPEAAAVLLDPRRQAILGHLQQKPNSASGLARLLEMPRQKVNYHLHELERAGLVEEVETKQRGATSERLVRARATYYLISPEALGELGPDRTSQRDRFSVLALVALASRCIRDLATLARRAARANKRLSTLSLETEIRFRNAEERALFADELSNMLVQLTAKYHYASAPGGREFRVFLGAYPKITKPEDPTDAPQTTA
jgi:DNA-binding transcriptional ArsR family regulator